MAELKEKLDNSLDETRIMILGTQVLLGFQYRAVFETGFDRLPFDSQILLLGALILLLVSLALLMLPVSHHHIVGHGGSAWRLNALAGVVMQWALLPFAAGLGLSLFIVFDKFGRILAIGLAAALVLVAVYFWYGLGLVVRTRRKPPPQAVPTLEAEQEATQLTERVDQVLTEARMVLPGAQALLGFQTIVVLTSDFDRLPLSAQYIHLGSLLMTALATILLIAPAAYHRLAEHGEISESFHRVATRFVVASMIPLALGLCGDLYVVVAKVTGSAALGTAGAIALLVFIYGLWFGLTLYRRQVQRGNSETTPANARG